MLHAPKTAGPGVAAPPSTPLINAALDIQTQLYSLSALSNEVKVIQNKERCYAFSQEPSCVI